MKKVSLVIMVMFFNALSWAQDKKEKIAILNVDTEGVNYTPVQVGNFVRIEIDKLGIYEVMDKYDVAYLVQKNGLNIQNCYGKICLQEIGEKLNADKMLSGTIEGFGQRQIVVSLKVIDIKSNSVENNSVMQFLFLPEKLEEMIRITINNLFEIPQNEALIKELTEKQLPSQNNVETNQTAIHANGTRVGLTVFSGEASTILQKPKSEGGYNVLPIMSQFGYQFEKQYLNEGRLQALFEVVPLVSGLDQGLFIPSCSFLNGLRDNRTGLEFSFGPSFTFIKKEKGYYDANGHWNLGSMSGFTTVDRLDSRGNPKLKSNFVFAIGKTFTSGNLNIPVNVFVVPEKDNFRYGISFGYNSIKNNKK
jgi:hypothetical protein